MPLPGRRIGRDDEAIECTMLCCQDGTQKRRAQIAGGADLQRDLALADHAGEIRVRHGRRPAIDVERHVRMHRQQMIAGDGAGARDRRPAGMASGDQTGGFRFRDQRHVVVGGLHRAEARLGEPHTLARHFLEVGLLQSRLQDHGAGHDAHSAGAVLSETALRRNRQRLHAFDVARTAGNVNLGRRDRGGDAAVQIAFEVADRALPRRVVAERDMDMRVDQARHRRHAVGVDDDIGAVNRGGRSRSYGRDPLAVNDDRIAARKGTMPIAGDDLAEVDDGEFHSFALTPSS